MFARSIYRSAVPLRQSLRSYATEASSGSSKTPLVLGVGGLAAAGAGYAYYSYGSAPAPAEAAVDPVKGEVKEAATTTTGPQTFTGGDQGFIDLKLVDVVILNHNTKKFRFELPDKDAVSGLHVASALLTKYKPADAEKPVIRPYTPISDEDSRGFLDLLVKRYPNGPMSEHIHSMTPGQRLDFKGPIPKYAWTANKHKHITLIAGGTGITPMYQLARAIFSNPTEKTQVTLVFGNMTESDILLKKEFEALEQQHPQRFRAFYTVDTAPESWPYGRGRITKELLKTVMPGPEEENIKVFVCGPPGLYQAVSGVKKSVQDQGELGGMLRELGYGKEQVYKF